MWPAIAIMTFVANSGCAIFTRYRVDALVLDAETGEAIENAEVAAYYSLWGNNSPLSLWTSPMTTLQARNHTDKNGRASITATRAADIKAKAPDYLVQTISYSSEVESVAPSPEMNGRNATLRLYRSPAPTVTIVVPDGYQGPLLIDQYPIAQWIAHEVGQRQFRFRANLRGYVRIEATPLLLNFDSVTSHQLRAQYASGENIPVAIGESDDVIALRKVVSCGVRDIFIIGTKHDENNLQSRIEQKLGPNTVTTDYASIEALFSTASSIGP